jgi:transmembrane sensor
MPERTSASMPAPDIRTPPPSQAQQPRVSEMTTALERADALRRQGKPERAADALARELSTRPRGPSSGLVALTLAQLQLDELSAPAEAARTFARALNAPALPAVLREQAMARRVEALARAGDARGAREAAEDYTRNHPNGSWSHAVRGWTAGEEPRSAP